MAIRTANATSTSTMPPSQVRAPPAGRAEPAVQQQQPSLPVPPRAALVAYSDSDEEADEASGVGPPRRPAEIVRESLEDVVVGPGAALGFFGAAFHKAKRHFGAAPSPATDLQQPLVHGAAHTHCAHAPRTRTALHTIAHVRARTHARAPRTLHTAHTAPPSWARPRAHAPTAPTQVG